VPPDEAVPVRAYTPALRAVAAALQCAALANLLELAARFALDAFAQVDAERAPLPLVVRRVFLFSALPWLLYLVCRALSAALLTSTASEVTIRARWGAVRIPRGAILWLRRWRVPLPEPGFDVGVPSGKIGLSWEAAAALGGEELADARARRRFRGLHRAGIKFGVVPAAVTFILFRLHQQIAFGDLFGEAQLFGWRRWMHTLFGVALYSFCTLLIAATATRIAIELVALITARLPGSWAGRARAALELTAAVLYYGGIASVLVLRLGL
jgi:hypothetical protein